MPKRILLIEDNRTNRELAVYILVALGYAVSTAADGEEGIAKAVAEKPDLIVCDIQLPKLDGFAVARHLKRDPELRHVPIVAVTALAMVGDRDRIIAGNFDGYIPKPIEPEKFGYQVAAFLDFGARPARGVAAKPDSAAREAMPRPPAPTRAGPPVILIVDDSGVNIDLFCRSLEHEGYEIVPCMQADEAIPMAKKHRPDLIVCDVHMPRRDGFAVLNAVKADPDINKIPFALISSTHWAERDRTIGLRLGADRFISRPIEPELLALAIADCLSQRKS